MKEASSKIDKEEFAKFDELLTWFRFITGVKLFFILSIFFFKCQMKMKMHRVLLGGVISISLDVKYFVGCIELYMRCI